MVVQNIDRKYIMDGLTGILVDALSVEPDEVTEDAALGNDLGAESIDFLDIVFRAEKYFGIKINRFEEPWIGLSWEGELNGFVEPANYSSTGFHYKITERGLNELRRLFHQVDFSRVKAGDDYEHVKGKATVGSLADYVQNKLGVKNGRIKS